MTARLICSMRSSGSRAVGQLPSWPLLPGPAYWQGGLLAAPLPRILVLTPIANRGLHGHTTAGPMTTTLLRRAARTALAVTRTGTTPHAMAIPFRQALAIRVVPTQVQPLPSSLAQPAPRTRT